MSQILDEIRRAYQPWGIELEGGASYGTYYRLRCTHCGSQLGSARDKLLPAIVQQLDQQFELYARGLLGCQCGYQAQRPHVIDPELAEAACQLT